jgi:hypothetical protein
MGSYLTNVQIFASESPVEDVRAAIIAALRSRAADVGLVEDATLADDHAEQVIMIGPAGPEPWIAVYDKLTEDQDPESLSELGSALSRVSAAARTVLVHDSDILQLGLYQDGAELDRYDSHPNYWREDPAEPRAPATGHAARWSSILAPGVGPATLRAGWEQHDLFADDTLRRVAGLFGWHEARCGLGFRRLAEVADDLDEHTRLAFRPSAEVEAARPPIFAEGPPRFKQGGGQVQMSVVAGAGFQAVGVSFRSAGGAGHGLQIVIWGSALEPGLIEPQAIRLIWKQHGASLHEVRECSLELGEAADGLPLRYASVDDVPIPAGLSEAEPGNPPSSEAAAGPDFASPAAEIQGLRSTSLTMHRRMDLLAATLISIVLSGEARTPGSGQLHVGIMPLEHPAGQTSWTLEVTVRAT